MKNKLNEHQFTNLIELIEKDYALYAIYKVSGTYKLEKYHGKTDLSLGDKTSLPFKKYLMPNGNTERDRKIALLGLPLCDVHAVHILLKKISKAHKVKRDNILIIGSDCQRDNTCFCEAMNGDHFTGFDLYIEKDSTGYKTVAKSNVGENYLNKLKLRNLKSVAFRQDLARESFSPEDVSDAINDKELFANFWLKIGNNCFACGACSAVCPLCFCGKQHFSQENEPYYDWDSCFNKNFSCVQNEKDLRPLNSDKIYNWYHHKFVRAPRENGDFLCTGCGRCIKACPANINIKNILSYFDKKIEDKINES